MIRDYTSWTSKIHYLKILEYFLRSIDFFFFLQNRKVLVFLKYFHLYTQYLVLSTFSTNDSISEVWHGSDQAVALLRHYWAFSLSVLLDRLFLIFLLKISHRFSMGFRSGMLSGQSSTVISWSANHLEGVLAVWAGAKFLLEKEISISIKLVSRWNLIQHNGPTPADVTGPQIITDFRNFSLDFKQHGFCASPLFLQTPDLDFQTKCNTFIWKEDFGPLSNSPVILLLSPGKMLLTMFLFQKWLGSPFPEDVWAWWLLMHWLQLQFTPCEALPSVWIGFAWQYSQACGHPCCLCTFSHPISSFQSTLHLIDTALFEQPPLSVMTLCDLSSLWRVSMIVFCTIDNQQCSPLLCIQRTRDTQNLYCMDGCI